MAVVLWLIWPNRWYRWMGLALVPYVVRGMMRSSATEEEDWMVVVWRGKR